MQKDITEKKDTENFKEQERFYDKVEPDTTRDTRRRGAGMDTLAGIVRGLKELVFDSSFQIRNRAGRPVKVSEFLSTGLLPFQSMFEMFFNTPPNNGNLNGITIGRQGDGKFRQTNLIQLEANHDTAIGDSFGYTNGVVRARVSRDKRDETDRSGLYVFDRGTESADRAGTVNWLVASGEGGQVRLTYIANKDDNPLTEAVFDIYISATGISMFGLPTSNPGGSGRVWKDGTTLRIT